MSVSNDDSNQAPPQAQLPAPQMHLEVKIPLSNTFACPFSRVLPAEWQVVIRGENEGQGYSHGLSRCGLPLVIREKT